MNTHTCTVVYAWQAVDLEDSRDTTNANDMPFNLSEQEYYTNDKCFGSLPRKIFSHTIHFDGFRLTH